MLTFLFVAAVIGFFVWLRVKKKKTSVPKPSGPLPTALDNWVAEALSTELRRVSGLASESAKTKLVGTLAGEPDPDVVSAISDAVRKVDLELTRYPHEVDAELAVVVRYEDGREGRITKRVPIAELPKDVSEEMATRAVTRVFREWQFSWER